MENQQKIIYLSRYEGQIKKESAGFIRLAVRGAKCQMDMHIRFRDESCKGAYQIVLTDQKAGEKLLPGQIRICNGIGGEKISFLLGENQYAKIQLRSTDNNSLLLEGNFPDLPGIRKQPLQPVEEVAPEKTLEPETVDRAENTGTDEPEILKTEESEILKTDKWQQLLKNYTNIHPYGDERIYLSIEPKDFVILRKEYQSLVNNSFLLHGFHNYRHIILGTEEDSSQGDILFYLGVPGVYYEKEKMIAVMFGFEGFESSEKPKQGTFGYYLRRVNI